ncbi:LysR family transcriptional regulator [Paludibacterium denitrificans]|uniref:LysR family transcriptional regulator n=1 Tax=Paludibacterium denitrificans TaxID=2675226 RepID=UPI002477FBBF|nr:LysR family transcriptional regulator [Paludibacterium denitrificans]
MNISLRQLQVFLAVARHRHFSRAGESIGLTQLSSQPLYPRTGGRAGRAVARPDNAGC